MLPVLPAGLCLRRAVLRPGLLRRLLHARRLLRQQDRRGAEASAEGELLRQQLRHVLPLNCYR